MVIGYLYNVFSKSGGPYCVWFKEMSLGENDRLSELMKPCYMYSQMFPHLPNLSIRKPEEQIQDFIQAYRNNKIRIYNKHTKCYMFNIHINILLDMVFCRSYHPTGLMITVVKMWETI